VVLSALSIISTHEEDEEYQEDEREGKENHANIDSRMHSS